jgi:hypothetical protein
MDAETDHPLSEQWVLIAIITTINGEWIRRRMGDAFGTIESLMMWLNAIEPLFKEYRKVQLLKEPFYQYRDISDMKKKFGDMVRVRVRNEGNCDLTSDKVLLLIMTILGDDSHSILGLCCSQEKPDKDSNKAYCLDVWTKNRSGADKVSTMLKTNVEGCIFYQRAETSGNKKWVIFK